MNPTESASKYNDLEKMSVKSLLEGMNNEDKLVPKAIEQVIPQIEAFVLSIVPKMKKGGRLFYIGAGTSGRLGIVDASECPPTYGIPEGVVVGIIAGGDKAIRTAVEFAEDDINQAWVDLSAYNLTSNDTVVGIAASGRTPYVVGGLKKCQENGITTGCIVCNEDSPVSKVSDFPIVAVVGPEFVTGSTRMKAGTAQKLILNMLSTTVMIQLGRVKGNKMVDMQLSNHKLVERGRQMIIAETGASYEQASYFLETAGSVRKAIEAFESQR